MSYNSGSTEAVLVGATNTDGPFTMLRFHGAAATATGAVPAGKRWRIIAASAGDADSYVAHSTAAPAIDGYIVKTAATALTSANIAGYCVAIIEAGNKIYYKGSGVCIYVEEDA